MDWVLIGTIIAIIILIVWYRFRGAQNLGSYTKENIETVNYNNNVEYSIIPNKCVCAFDIDYTITCGNPKPFVDKCIEHGCKLAINTARPIKYIGDVDLDSINFKSPFYEEEDLYYNTNSYSQTATQVAEVKTTFLDLLRNKYTIPDKKCVILLDDHKTNIKIAESKGYSTIKAIPTKGPNCGLDSFDLQILDDKLSFCEQV